MKIKDIIYECVIRNIRFQNGPAGNYYTIQHLLSRDVGTKMIDGLYRAYNNKLKTLTEDSLFKQDARQVNILTTQVEALKAAFAFQQEREELQAQRREARKELENRRAIKEQRAYQDMLEEGKKAFDKRIKELESILAEED